MMARFAAGEASIRGWRIRRRRRRSAAGPWAWDYAWNPARAKPTGLVFVLSNLLGLSVAAAFWSLFNGLALKVLRRWDPSGIAPALLALAGDAVRLWALGYTLQRLWRRLVEGWTTRLAFPRFPFFLGEELNVELGGRRFRRAAGLAVTLRSVEESVRDVSVLHTDRRTLALRPGAPRAAIPISFPLPDGDQGTRLTERPFRYWELHVQPAAAGRGVLFLPPVYRRP